MVKLRIIATGLLKDDNLKAVAGEFYKRLSKWCKIEEIILPEIPPKNDGEIELAKQKQAQIQIEKFMGYNIVLDRGGKEFSSEEFAKKIESIQVDGNSTISFFIGGSNGFSKSVINKADLLISFGKLTLPHELAKTVLIEQIYRAFTINNNIAYHK